MDFLSCLRLLHECVKTGLIQSSPKDSNCILVYREAGELFPEGWYAENIYDVAGELVHDEEGQRFLIGELKEKEIEFKEESYL